MCIAGNSISNLFVLINLWVEFPDASKIKNEEIMPQWNKIYKYNVKITRI